MVESGPFTTLGAFLSDFQSFCLLLHELGINQTSKPSRKRQTFFDELNQIDWQFSAFAQSIRATPFPEKSWLLALSRGSEILKMHSDSIQPIYEELQELDHGAMDLRIGLIAAFWHALVCANEHLTTKATVDVDKWLGQGSCLWGILATMDPTNLFYRFSQEERPVQCLLVTSIMGICGDLRASREWFISLWRVIFNAPIPSSKPASEAKAIETKHVLMPVPPEFLGNLLLLLEKENVKTVYEKQFLPQEFEEKYQMAKNSLEGNVFFLPDLRENWGIVGITLPNGCILIDEPGKGNLELLYGYQLLVALHEFAHFSTRVEKVKWRDFFNVVTPPASPPKATGHDAPLVAEEVKEFNPNMSPLEQEFNERIGISTSQLPATAVPQEDEDELLSQKIVPGEREEYAALIARLVEAVPLKAHNEAGLQLENALFGVVKDMYLSAARELTRWATDSRTLEQFKADFTRANQEGERRHEPSISCRKATDPESGGNWINVRGACPLP